MKAVINVTQESGVTVVSVDAGSVPAQQALTLARVFGAAANALQLYGELVIEYMPAGAEPTRRGFCRRCVTPCYVFTGRCGGCGFEAEPCPDARQPVKAADCPFPLALFAGGTVEVTGGSDPAAAGWWQRVGEWMVPIAPPLRSCGCVAGAEHCADYRRRTGAGVVPGGSKWVPVRGRGGAEATCRCFCHGA